MRKSDASPAALGWGLVFIVCIIITWLAFPVITTAQDEPIMLFIQLINLARQRQGLAPYDTSTLLNQAAQRHAEDLVSLGTTTQHGSDGSTPQQRIATARYQAWNDGLLVNEVEWIGLGTVMDAVNWFRTDPAAWQIITDPLYREAGIGYVENNGIRYLVMTLGSRPGVLPIFINDGAELTESPSVAVRLTNEEAVPFGEGTWIGKAIEVRLSNSPDFEGELWQAWEPLLPWNLAGVEPGDYAVYVEYRDGAGRTAIAEDTIRLVAPGEIPPATAIILPDVPDLVLPTVPETTAEPVVGEVTVEPETTLAAGTPQITIVAPTREFVPPLSTTPRPTWTPLNMETPVVEETQPRDWPLILSFVLQGAAIILGIATFLKRR